MFRDQQRPFCDGNLLNSTDIFHIKQPLRVSDCLHKLCLLTPTCCYLILTLLLHLYKRRKCGKLTDIRDAITTARNASHRMHRRLKSFLMGRLTMVLLWTLVNFFMWISTSLNNVSTHLVYALLHLVSVMEITILFRNFQYWYSSWVSAIQFTFYFVFSLVHVPSFYTELVNNQWSLPQFWLSNSIIILSLINALMAIISSPLHTLPRNPQFCPEIYSEFPSKLTFWWLNPIITQSRRHPLKDDQLFQLRQEEDVKECYQKLEEAIQVNQRRPPVIPRKVEEKEPLLINTIPNNTSTFRKNYDSTSSSSESSVSSSSTTISSHEEVLIPLWRVFLRAFFPALLRAWCFKLFHFLLQFTNPFLLQYLIDFVTNSNQPAWIGYSLAFLFLLVGITAGTLFEQHNFEAANVALRFQSALTAKIYRKATLLSNEARQKASIGEVINLMSIDTERIQLFLLHSYALWSTPLEIVVCIILLWRQVGVATLAGLLTLLILIPLNGFIISRAQKKDVIQMEWKDKRLKLLHDILHGIRVLKLYAWERSYEKKIQQLRKQELNCLRYIYYSWTGVNIIWDMAPYLVMLITLAAFIYTGSGSHVLTPSIAFVSLTLFNMLRFPLVILPWMLSFAMNAYVSSKRMTLFFGKEEISRENMSLHNDFDASEPAINLSHASFAWKRPKVGKPSQRPVLSDIDIKIAHGKLVAVVGPIGCGKSSLLSAIIGEMRLLSGRVSVNGTLAYVPQSSWIQHMTIKENILFGKEEDPEWYEEVITRCALLSDMENFARRDETTIGERGINLSGGQKQRISLARAVYQNSDIYLLDDSLSAVDSHVGKQLFHSVIGPQGVLWNKTRILVTHDLQWLPFTDEVIVIGSTGSITERGSYNDLINNDKAFAGLIRNVRHTRDVSYRKIRANMKQGIRPSTINVIKISPVEPVKLQRRASRALSTDSIREGSIQVKHIINIVESDEEEEEEEEEFMETGGVSCRVYAAYVMARGIFIILIGWFGYAVFAASIVISGIWIQRFTEDPVLINATNYPLPLPADVHWDVVSITNYYLTGYGLIGVVELLAAIIFILCEAKGAIRAATILHNSLLDRIMRAQLSFFDTTPAGRIINRFSRDIEVIDRNIPEHWNDGLQTLFTLLSALVVIIYSTPTFLIAFIPLVIIYSFIQLCYIPIARQSRRLAAITRSPIFTHFAETLAGLPVIRSFARIPHFVNANDQFIYRTARYTFLKAATNCWLNWRLQFLGSLVTFLAVLLGVIGRSWTSAGLIGLSISFALTVTDDLHWLVQQFSEIETDAVSIERVLEYSNAPKEGAWEIEGIGLPPDWPTNGEIIFEQYGARYRPTLPLVLRNLSIEISAGEKIGIVGRTGAGKSTLTLALFRLVEAEEGRILIDGVDIQQIGLHQLRSNITILPQDPVLFNGTLRDNIDPFSIYSDAELWFVLQSAHLHDWVATLPTGLSYECGEGGQNLSVGQRQLVCLARAILHKSKVLILDEATASVDQNTDDLVMNTLLEQFQDSTILIIAHRLSTILSTNRVIVMSEGSIAEVGPPYQLLSDSNTSFYSMAKEAGLVDEIPVGCYF